MASAPVSDENVDLLEEMCSDPHLLAIFAKLDGKQYEIPEYYEDELAASVKLDLPTVVNISSPEDYQTVMQLLIKAQMCRERVVEITRHVVAMKHRWEVVHKTATRRLNKAYFNSMKRLPEHMRRTVMSTALYPIEANQEKIESLCTQSEVILKHFDQTLWNVKEMSRIMTEYFALLRYGSGGSNV